MSIVSQLSLQAPAVGLSSAPSPLRIRPLRAGESWRPYNYETLGAGAGQRHFQPRPGYTVLGAFRDDRLVGCAEFSVCDEERLLSSGEYNRGWALNGPFFRDPRAAAGERFLLLHSLWVDPGERRAGIGAALCAHLQERGLAGYAEFASDAVCGWFHRRYSPAVCRQRAAAAMSRAPGTDERRQSLKQR
jgi:ribosomal protein S18 acetylase RimI-like enzyme